jgi:hypothetical protein
MSVGFSSYFPFRQPAGNSVESGNPAMNVDGTRYNPAASH